MMAVRGGWTVKVNPRFESDFDALSVDIQKEVAACFIDFQRDPLPSSRRPHSVTPKGTKPQIFTMDVTKNKAYKLSYIVIGGTAELLRVGTHRVINRDPGRTEAKELVSQAK